MTPDIDPVSPLVDVQTLHAALQDPGWLVVDCRHDLGDAGLGRRVYAQAHLPGAFFMHLDEQLSGPKTGPDGRFRGRHPLPERAVMAQRLADLGLTPRTRLVAYDAGDGMYAARLWWLARWLGHARVAVLDGGLAAWTAAGFEVTAELPAPRAQAAPLQAEPLVATVEAGALLEGVGTSRFRLLDARAPERYRGEVEPLDAKAGHIPGAYNRVFRRNLGADGRFKPAGQLRAEFVEALDGAPPDSVVHQCGSGVTACHNLLAMAVAGIDGSKLYPGSWSEWSSDPARPVAIGPFP